MLEHAGRSQSSDGAPQLAALNSDAPQPAALNSGDSQPAALSGPMQKLVEDVKQFGRIPKRNKGTSEQERAENILAKRFWRHRNSIPKDILQELHDFGGAPQPAVLTRGQELIDAVKTLGFFPKETRPTGDEGMQEFQLALKIRRCQFTPAERIEIDELRRTSVHPRDRAMDFPFARLPVSESLKETDL